MTTETLKMTPKARPQNLKAVSAPTGKPKADLTSTEPAAVFEWAEAIRDEYQAKGELLTARGLLAVVRNNVKNEDSQKAIRRVIKSAYAKELAAEEAARGANPKAKASAKVAAKAKAKPSANGHAKADKPAKAKKGKAPAPPTESEVEYEGKVNGIPIKVTKSGTGRRRPSVDGQPAREVLRWMGSKGFDVPGATKVMNKIFAGIKDEEYVTGFCVEGHVGSGRKGQEGVFGPFKAPSKEVAKALLALKK